MPVRRLNHAVLYVNGLDREVDFYTRTLGFEVHLQIPGQAAFLRSPESANDHDLGLFDVGAGHADGVGRSGSTTSPGRSARWRNWSKPGRSWSTRAPWWGERSPALQVAVRQGPERHRVRGAVAGAGRGWESELAQGDGYTVPLDWDRTLTRWDTHRRPARRPAPRPDRPGRDRVRSARSGAPGWPGARTPRGQKSVTLTIRPSAISKKLRPGYVSPASFISIQLAAVVSSATIRRTVRCQAVVNPSALNRRYAALPETRSCDMGAS